MLDFDIKYLSDNIEKSLLLLERIGYDGSNQIPRWIKDRIVFDLTCSLKLGVSAYNRLVSVYNLYVYGFGLIRDGIFSEPQMIDGSGELVDVDISSEWMYNMEKQGG